MEFKGLCFALCFLLSAASVSGQGFHPPGQISEVCFECLCEASTGCDMEIGCVSNGVGQYHCGPYYISYEYWVDGGKPDEDPDNPLDFEQCLNKKPCAEASIRGYVQKWSQDCNGDQQIDCYDWGLIHKAGPYGCNGTWVQKTEFWSRFRACYDKVYEFYDKASLA
ncbi:Lysozyme, partial [Stegodyphus mimosarum]